MERWLRDYAAVNVSGKTLERYEEIVRQQLTPALGHHQLAKLQPLHIQECYSRALKGGRKDGSGGLSLQTVLHHHRVLYEALKQAVRWQLVARNCADAVEPPRPRRKEVRPLNEEQTAQLMGAARGTRLHIPVLLAVSTGMRRGEILGLRWEDVDLVAGTVTVNQSIEETRAGLAFKEPKTNKGRRRIPLPGIAVEGLQLHKAEQAKERLQLGPVYQDFGLVCARPDGRPWVPSYFSAAFIAIIRGAGLGGVSFHDLRHGHATQLLRQGVHPKVVSERLGHSTIGITMDVYSHVMPGMQEEAARGLDSALRTALSAAAGSEGK